jgi:tetratricopeptide (TPR) repeat protein
MSTAPMPQHPPVAVDRGDRTFVGRRREMAALRASLEATVRGTGRLDLISGPPGIGKTRLAHEVAAVAQERGFYVLRGGCWESEGAPAYWPWSALLRQHLGVAAAPLGASAEFSPLLEIAATQAGVPVRGVVDATREAQQARFMLFDRCCEFLAVVARTRPTLVIIDDVQFADTGSLLLLQFLVARLAEIPIALLVTSRDPLSELTASTTRHPWSRHRVLPGLSRSETRTLLAAYAPAAPRPSQLDRVMHLTEGNPYFVKEFGHILASGNQLVDRSEPMVWPPSLLAITLQPYHRLSPACRTLLEAASVIGREFDAEVAAHAARVPIPGALLLLDEAVQHRVVAAIGPGRYQFLHALVREAVRDQLHPSYRTRLHESIGLALQRLATTGKRIPPAILAYHFCNALPLTQRRQAAEYCIAAGRYAHAAFAYEEAVFQLQRAQETHGALLTPRESCELLLDLGAAEAGAGAWAQSRRTFEDAAVIARQISSPEHLARAALGFRGMMWGTIPVDSDAITRLEEARIQIGDKFPTLQVELLSALSRSLYFSTEAPRAQTYSEQALQIAAHISDRKIIANALETHAVTLLRPGTAHDLLAASATLLDLGDELRDPQVRFNARMFRQFALLSLGRINEANNDLEHAIQIAHSAPYPRFRWQLALIRAARAELQGDIRSAQRLSMAAQTLGTRVHGASPIQYHLLQAFHRTHLSNDITLWTNAFNISAKQLPHIPPVQVAQAWLFSRMSHLELASESVHALAPNNFACIPDNHLCLYLLSVLADVVSTVNDTDTARTLYDRLTPHSSSHIVAAWGALIDGSVSHYLGMLASTLNMLDVARNHFELAIEHNRRLGAPALTARSSLHLAALLLRTGYRADIDTAHSLAKMAAGIFTSLKLHKNAEFAQSLCRSSAAIVTREPKSSVDHSHARCEFRRTGDFWVISFDDRTSLLRASLGLQYIGALLARPCTPIHVLDLIGSHNSRAMSNNQPLEIADRNARHAYKQRLKEIELELTDADLNHDLGTSERLLAERDGLLAELTRAYSLSGSPRSSHSNTERARISVRNRIAASLRSIHGINPACATFLRRSIKTGSICVYEPILPVKWEL